MTRVALGPRIFGGEDPSAFGSSGGYSWRTYDGEADEAGLDERKKWRRRI